MKFKYFPIAMACALTCSCSSLRHTATTADVDVKIVNFTVADMTVSPEKVSKTYDWGYNPFRRISIETVKTNTTAEILRETNADLLIEPQYVVEKRGVFRGGSVTVIGFPATYSNFHKMTPEEAEIVKAASQNRKQEKGRKCWFIF